jgi:hypothetical protein
MIEIYCVIEDPAEDDFVCLLRKNEAGAWGGLPVAESSAHLFSAVKSAVGGSVQHMWPLCDRVRDEAPAHGDRRQPEKISRTHLGALVGAEGLLLDGEWAAVPFDDASAMVPEGDRRVLALARQGAWIHKVAQVEQ